MHVIYKTPKQENLHYVDHTFYQGHVDAFLHAEIYIYKFTYIYIYIYIASLAKLENYYI